MDRIAECIRQELGAEDYGDIEVWWLGGERADPVPEGDEDRYGARYADLEVLITESEARSLLRRGARDVSTPKRSLVPVAPTLRP